MIVCTIITASQIPKAKIMADSVKQHLVNSKVVICLVEQTVHPAVMDIKSFDRIILAKDLEFQWPKFDRIVFKYNYVEAVSAVKGQFIKDLHRMYREENDFIYLDHGMKLFNPCSELFDSLNKHPIVITPHQLVPSDMSREVELLNEGTFHGGLLAIRRTDESERFIEWFADRLNRFFEDPHKGQHLDKKFLNLAIAAFDVHILKHPGYNVGEWNFHERMIASHDGTLQLNGNRMCIFNYSNSDDWRTESKNFGNHNLSNEPWSYDFFKSGEYIDRETRIKYRTSPSDYDQCPDLFEESNHSLVQKYGRNKT